MVGGPPVVADRPRLVGAKPWEGLGSPQSFTLEEKAVICDEMEATNKAIEDAIRKDFEALPPEFQGKLLDMLCESGCMTPEWWRETLFGAMPSSVDEIAGKEV